MASVERFDGGTRSVVVIGAGVVGLSTAWFLQERGIDVTLVDRTGIGAGASSRNAGWIAPDLTLPLNRSVVLGTGLKALLNLKVATSPGLARFLPRFFAHGRDLSWKRNVAANAPLNVEALEAFDVLTDNGVNVPVTDCSINVLFRTGRGADDMLRKFRQLDQFGQADVLVSAYSGAALRKRAPMASPEIKFGLSIHGQRFVDPQRFVRALGRSVIARGASLRILNVSGVRADRRAGIVVDSAQGEGISADAVVIATGAWLPRLAGHWLKTPVQSVRGYSFTVPVTRPITEPIYLPHIRVAATPHQGGLKIGGSMEFRAPDEPIVPESIEKIIASARPLLDGVLWEERRDEWVGARPVTTDSRPLIGQVAPEIYVAGGHGMWGFTHGPVTGRLLAERITTGKQSEALRGLDPLRLQRRLVASEGGC